MELLFWIIISLIVIIILLMIYINKKEQENFNKIFKQIEETEDTIEAFLLIDDLIEKISSFEDAEKTNKIRHKIYSKLEKEIK